MSCRTCRRGYFHAHALTASGAIARLFARADADESTEIKFVPPRTVTVTVTYPDGEAAPGIPVHLRNQGNNPIGPAVESDAAGIARITSIYGGERALYDVYLGAGYADARRIGTAKLSEGDAQFEATVFRTRTVRARFEGIDSLPDALHAQIARAQAHEIARDPGDRSITFSWRPASSQESQSLVVRVAGYQAASVPFTLPAVDETPVVTISLERAGVLHVGLRLPKELQSMRAVGSGVWVQRYDEAKKTWGRTFYGNKPSAWRASLDANGDGRVEPLPSGRYRALWPLAGLTSEAVEVRPGEALLAEIDGHRAGRATGRIEGPEGLVTSELVVYALNTAAEVSPSQAVSARLKKAPTGLRGFVANDGSFWMIVPGNRPLTLTTWGPGVKPAPTGGQIEVTEPREGLVLRVEAARQVRMRFDPPIRSALGHEARSPLRVYAYEGAFSGQPTHTWLGTLRDSGALAVLDGHTAGTWKLWIDAVPHAPLRLQGVVLHAEQDTDLGTLRPEKGRTLDVHVIPKAGASTPRFGIWLRLDGPPTMTRGVYTKGSLETERLTVSGLLPGTYTYRAMAAPGSPGGRHEGRVEVPESGVGPPLVIDLNVPK